MNGLRAADASTKRNISFVQKKSIAQCIILKSIQLVIYKGWKPETRELLISDVLSGQYILPKSFTEDL